MRLLYVDVPFQGLRGGDKNRSNFIWNTLSREFDADLLLIKTAEYAFKPVPTHTGYKNLHFITSQTACFYQADAIHRFHPNQLKKFKTMLQSQHYDKIVFRFLSCFVLAELAHVSMPNADISIDVDMLFSRITELSWQQNPSIRNRYNLVEMVKLKAYEASAFKKDFHFFFTNVVERDMAIHCYGLSRANGIVFPNMMPEEIPIEIIPMAEPKRYILFFGTLNSVANSDAFMHLMKDIYPHIKETLIQQNIQIHIVGKNPLPLYEKFADDVVKIIGPVDDINSTIANSLFVVLPIRIASGTRTRILEAAALKKAVISTSIGMEGFEFLPDELIVHDDAKAFADSILNMLESEDKATELGQKLYAAAVKKYSPEVVAANFLNVLMKNPSQAEDKVKRRKIAIITNRFYPEVGGAETNIYFQARLLAKHHDLTVICPKRIDRPKKEEVDGFTVLRLYDVLNRPVTYPNLRQKTLCPELLCHLLTNHYDIIQCFPALNYNNILAFIAAKLKITPYILCFFDFIDYAGHIKEHGKIDPNILKTVKAKWYQRIVLKGMDFAYAIANKEIEFLKQFNPHVDYSPVPILTDEYEVQVPDPRPRLFPKASKDLFVFLSLGRVSNIKGQDIALKAFAKVYQNMPEAHLVFVGRSDYEAEFIASMQSFISENKLSERVHFTGMVEREEVLGWLRYSDIHVIPVRFMNSGAVVVESWISDTPVLQSDVVDPNLVVEDVNGYLFRLEDIDHCAEKMLKAYQNRDKFPALAAAGKELVFTKYTYEYLIDHYEKTYERLIDK